MLFLFIILSLSLFAQDQVVVWQQNAGGSSYDVSNALIIDGQGNYILSGYTLSDDGDVSGYHGNGYEDVFVVKISHSGSLIWAKCFGGDSQDISTALFSIDTSFYMANYTWSGDGDIPDKKGGEDFWILELNAQGNITHNFVYGGSLSDECYSIISTGNYFFTVGKSISSDIDFLGNSSRGYDAALVKAQSDGQLVLAKTYGGSGTEIFYSVKYFAPYIFCVGMSNTQDTSFIGGYGSSDALVSIINEATGEALRHKRYGGSNYDVANDICRISDTSFMVVGYSASDDGCLNVNYGSYDAWIFAINSYGDTLWSKNYGGSREDAFSKVIHTQDNNFLAVGYTSSDDGDVHGHYPGNKDIWVVKLNAQGDTIWTKCLGSTVEDAATGIVEAKKNHFIISGYTQSANGDVTDNYGLSDFWIAEITSSTTQLVVRIDIPKVKIYPNPTYSFVYFDTDFQSPYKIEITNEQGKLIKEKECDNGYGKIDLSEFAVGIYWIKFSSKNSTITKKVIRL